jgi:kinesin family protein 4/21/27
MQGTKKEVVVDAARTFKFDHVFDYRASQEEVFEGCNIESQYINKVLEGYHATIFAYGQTGSGKTHTMEGFDYMLTERGPKPRARQDPLSLGLIPRIVERLFANIE